VQVITTLDEHAAQDKFEIPSTTTPDPEFYDTRSNYYFIVTITNFRLKESVDNFF